jgi:hypothetical protein
MGNPPARATRTSGGCARPPLALGAVGRVVTWWLCAGGQVGPVVPMCAGKARRILNRSCQGQFVALAGPLLGIQGEVEMSTIGGNPVIHGWFFWEPLG